jgi:hypothetical protein
VWDLNKKDFREGIPDAGMIRFGCGTRWIHWIQPTNDTL